MNEFLNVLKLLYHFFKDKGGAHIVLKKGVSRHEK